MFTVGMAESQQGRVVFEGVDGDIFKIFLEFLYTGDLDRVSEVLTPDIALHLIPVIHQYGKVMLPLVQLFIA